MFTFQALSVDYKNMLQVEDITLTVELNRVEAIAGQQGATVEGGSYYQPSKSIHCYLPDILLLKILFSKLMYKIWRAAKTNDTEFIRSQKSEISEIAGP